MFMDIPASGEGGFEPLPPRCHSCKQFIAHGAPTETVAFPVDQEHHLQDLNGLYHAECARPYLSIYRALDMLSRPRF
jgi:hypothetical protein